MNEYIVSLEREFSLIENGFKVEESRALVIINLMIMNLSKVGVFSI